MDKFLLWLVIIATMGLGLWVLNNPAWSADQGQWEDTDPNLRAWYGRQMMPDYPTASCCGLADAYYADKVEITNDGRVFAIITDDRPDAPLGRPHVPVGTKIEIPVGKYKDTHLDPNPTGHSILFLHVAGQAVLCFLADGGV